MVNVEYHVTDLVFCFQVLARNVKSALRQARVDLAQNARYVAVNVEDPVRAGLRR